MRTFSDALPADAARLIRNLNRRQRYQTRLDRPKVWADSRYSANPFISGFRDRDEVEGLLEELRSGDIATYARAWCVLNHLKTGEVER